MNDFTKEELMQIADAILYSELFESRKECLIPIRAKIMLMIENYKIDPWNTKKIAESHLREAESLISHAMCLLGMKEEV